MLLGRAQAAGVVRPELTVADLVALFKGMLATVRADPDQGLRERVFAVVRDGLRTPGFPAAEGLPGINLSTDPVNAHDG